MAAHAKKTVIKCDNSAGALQDISTYCDEAGFPREANMAETTGFSPTGNAKTYVPGLKDGTFSASGKWDAALDAILAPILGQDASVSIEYGPEGSAAGKVKYSFESHLTSYEPSGSVDDVVTFSAEWQVTGDVTRGVWP